MVGGPRMPEYLHQHLLSQQDGGQREATALSQQATQQLEHNLLLSMIPPAGGPKRSMHLDRRLSSVVSDHMGGGLDDRVHEQGEGSEVGQNDAESSHSPFDLFPRSGSVDLLHDVLLGFLSPGAESGPHTAGFPRWPRRELG